MILVRVREQHDIDPSVPERHHLAQAAQRELRIGSAIDQHAGAARRGQQDGIALPDVEGHDMHPTVRASGEADARQQRDDERADGRRMECDPRHARPAIGWPRVRSRSRWRCWMAHQDHRQGGVVARGEPGRR